MTRCIDNELTSGASRVTLEVLYRRLATGWYGPIDGSGKDESDTWGFWYDCRAANEADDLIDVEWVVIHLALKALPKDKERDLGWRAAAYELVIRGIRSGKIPRPTVDTPKGTLDGHVRGLLR